MKTGGGPGGGGGQGALGAAGGSNREEGAMGPWGGEEHQTLDAALCIKGLWAFHERRQKHNRCLWKTAVVTLTSSRGSREKLHSIGNFPFTWGGGGLTVVLQYTNNHYYID